MTPLEGADAGYLAAPWGRVHVRFAGGIALDEQLVSGRPILLLLHQSPLSSRRYVPALSALSSFCVPIAIDTPGYGESEAGRGEWEAADYAAVPWFVADALGVERPWLFGRATGAAFVLEAAAQQPDRAAGVMLHGVPVYTEQEKERRLADFAPPYRITADGGHLRWIWDRISGEYPWAEASLVNSFLGDYLVAGPDFASSYRAIWRQDLTSAIQRAGPVDLLLAGTADRIFTMHERARQAVPYRQEVVLTGANDFVAELEPERFAATLAATMSRTETDQP